MATKDYSNTLVGRLNSALLTTLSTLFQMINLGAFIRSSRTFLRGKAPDAINNSYVLNAAVQSIALPEAAKCHTIRSVYARGGTGTKGLLTVDQTLYSAANTAPAAGHCSVSPNGDLLFAAADAWTLLDIVYEPEKYDVIELQLPAVASVVTLPTWVTARGVLFLMEAESLVGTLVAKMNVVASVDAAPATTKAALKLAKDTVNFAVADGVTSARVKLAIASAVDVDAVLEAAPTAL